MLALKLLLVPFFLGLVSLASARFGPAVGGWLAGFPVVGGPILLFIAIERGPEFASLAAVSSLAGVNGAVILSLAYTWVSRRWHWSWCALGGIAAWWVLAALYMRVDLGLWGTLASVLGALLIAPSLFPRHRPVEVARPLGAVELVARMVAGAALMFATTAVAPLLGPELTGMLAVFPILTLVLAIFSHRSNGADFVVVLLRSMMRGLFAFATFGLVLSLTLQVWGTAPGFLAATLAATVVHLAVRVSTTRSRAL